MLLPACASVSLAASSVRQHDSDEIIRQHTYQIPPVPRVTAQAQVAKVVKFQPPLPRLVLPNFAARIQALQRADRSMLPSRVRKSSQVLAFFKARSWMAAPRRAKCREVPWQRTCTLARAEIRLYVAMKKVAKRRLEHEIPLINDWRTAVIWVQRIYPGTESWMLYISDREGGWGPWVWYGGRRWGGYHVGDDFLGADTVGGWMQFRYSTFAPYWRGAQKNLRSRGYEVPFIPMPAAGGNPKYAAWLSPLGQALTAGYMRYYGKDGCHWCL